MSNLPSPPVPQKLREMLKDYPEHLARLQAEMDRYIAQPARSTRFHDAIWALEDQLGQFVLETRDASKIAQATGDVEVIARAKAKESWMFNVLNHSDWMGHVEELWSYFETHQDVFKGDPPSVLSNGLPPPPVPQRLQEMLKDYPGYLAGVQQSLNRLIEKPLHGSPPFERAIWSLEDTLGDFLVKAGVELRAIEAGGDTTTIQKAREKEFTIGYARGNMGDMNDLWAYFEAHGGV